MHNASAAVAEINFGEYIRMVSPLWTGSQAVFPGRLRVQRAKRALKNVHEWLRANPVRPGLGRRATYTRLPPTPTVMNYRHACQAGKFADALGHTVLSVPLDALQPPFRVIERFGL